MDFDRVYYFLFISFLIYREERGLFVLFYRGIRMGGFLCYEGK